MNKKVKWSIITVSTVSFLTFGGLVAGNQNIANTTSTTSSDADERAFQDDYSTSDNDSYDQSSSWEQDSFQQAPHNGFDQGNGSSGTSK